MTVSIASGKPIGARRPDGIDRHREVAGTDEDHIDAVGRGDLRDVGEPFGRLHLHRDQHLPVGGGEIFEDAVAVAGGPARPDAALALRRIA